MSNPNLSFIKIGTDGSFLPIPQIVKSLLISPAERYDVIVDFTGLTPGSVVYFNNSAAAPFPDGTASFSPPQTNTVMQIKVVASSGSALPAGPSWRDVMSAVQQVCNGSSPATSYDGVLHRELTLQEFDDASGSPIVSTLGNRTWTDPVTEIPKLGAVEVWEMINLTPDAHPIHLHLIQFVVLNQQPFDTGAYVIQLFLQCSVPYSPMLALFLISYQQHRNYGTHIIVFSPCHTNYLLKVIIFYSR